MPAAFAPSAKLRASLAELPQIKLVPSNATYLLWLDCTSLGISSRELAGHIRKSTGLYLSSGDIITSDLKEGYQGQIRNVYLSGDKLYYSYFYLAEDIDYSKWDTASAEFEEYINSINRTEIKCFDVKTKEETQLWTGSGSCECMDYGYTVVKEKCPIAIRLADNKQSMLDKTYNNCRFTIDETGIIVSDYDSYKYSVWDPETNETKETATYNKDDYLTFTAVTDSLYFVSYYTEDD